MQQETALAEALLCQGHEQVHSSEFVCLTVIWFCYSIVDLWTDLCLHQVFYCVYWLFSLIISGGGLAISFYVYVPI